MTWREMPEEFQLAILVPLWLCATAVIGTITCRLCWWIFQI